MHVPEIIAVKNHLDMLKAQGFIKEWELPHENLLTRRNAAIFFLTPASSDDELLNTIWRELSIYDSFTYRLNYEKKISQLLFRVSFNSEEKEKNLSNTNGKRLYN